MGWVVPESIFLSWGWSWLILCTINSGADDFTVDWFRFISWKKVLLFGSCSSLLKKCCSSIEISFLCCFVSILFSFFWTMTSLWPFSRRPAISHSLCLSLLFFSAVLQFELLFCWSHLAWCPFLVQQIQLPCVEWRYGLVVSYRQNNWFVNLLVIL